MANRAPPTGYNPPQRPLAWWHYLLSVMAVVLVIAATLLTARLFQQLGMPPDWSYGLPAFGFAAWCVAWTSLVHNATIPTAGTVWTRRVLIGIAVAGVVLPIISLATMVV